MGRWTRSSAVRPLDGAALAEPWETAFPVTNSERVRVLWVFFFREGLVVAATESVGNSKESVFGWGGGGRDSRDSMDSCSSESKAQAPGFDHAEEVPAISFSLYFLSSISCSSAVRLVLVG